MRKALKTSNDMRRIAADWSERQLRLLEGASSRERFLIGKGRTIIALLRNQPYHLYELQRSLVDTFVKKSSILTGVQCIREISLLTRIAALIGDRSSVIKYSVITDQIETVHPIDRNELLRKSVTLQITFGASFVNTSLIDSGLKILEANSRLFSQTRILKFFMFSALGFFYGNRFHDAIDLIQKIRAASFSSRGDMLWEPEVLLLVIHHELETPDVHDSLLASAYHAVKKTTNGYPRKIVSILRKLNQLPGSEHLSYLEASLHELEKLKSILPEGLLFDFTIWVRSKIDRVSMIDVVNEMNKVNSQTVVSNLSI